MSIFRPKQCLIILLVMTIASAFISHAWASTIRDTEIEDALLRLIRPMAIDAGLNPETLKIRIIIDPEFNAFVTVDNTIYINSGLIIDARSIYEVAGVLAHEIGHIASGHVLRRGEVVGNATLATVLGAVAAIALTASGNGDAAVGTLIGSVDQTNRIILAHSRQDESVADQWAIKLMEKRGYSTKPIAKMMARLARERLLPEDRQSEYYLSHPGVKQRGAIFQTHAASLSYADTPPSPELQDLLQDILSKLRGWTESPRLLMINTSDDETLGGRYARATAFYRLNDIPAALEMVDELIQDVPDNPYFHEFRGDILLSAARANDAAQAYRQSLSLLDASVNRGQILLSLGRAMMASGDDEQIEEAISALEQANILEPDWSFIKHQLGISYGRAGRLADADLILAERAVLIGNKPLALQLAKRVTKNPEATHIQQRLASDIIREADK